MKNLKIKNNNINFSISVIFLSIALILGYIEALFPVNIGIIGIKIGLPNIVTILAIKTVGTKKAFIINVLRLLILGMLFSNMVRFAISVAGFVISFIVMVITIEMLDFDIIIASILGGVFHNIGQVICVSLITSNLELYKIIYIYIIVGIISGMFVGIVSKILYNALKKVYK
ncbi:MAG: Gx transporter family protein [Lachnospiraceae bacterium]|nr:Gx transporter family protein [Lachnospiraceae bacterium]